MRPQFIPRRKICRHAFWVLPLKILGCWSLLISCEGVLYGPIRTTCDYPKELNNREVLTFNVETPIYPKMRR